MTNKTQLSQYALARPVLVPVLSVRKDEFVAIDSAHTKNILGFFVDALYGYLQSRLKNEKTSITTAVRIDANIDSFPRINIYARKLETDLFEYVFCGHTFSTDVGMRVKFYQDQTICAAVDGHDYFERIFNGYHEIINHPLIDDDYYIKYEFTIISPRSQYLTTRLKAVNYVNYSFRYKELLDIDCSMMLSFTKELNYEENNDVVVSWEIKNSE